MPYIHCPALSRLSVPVCVLLPRKVSWERHRYSGPHERDNVAAAPCELAIYNVVDYTLDIVSVVSRLSYHLMAWSTTSSVAAQSAGM